MTYEVRLLSKAERFLKKLNKNIQERIITALERLEKDPKIGIPLTANLAGLWKLRIGDYRAIYQIKHEELLILVLKIGHRKNVYE